MSYVTRYNVRAWHKLKSELYLSEGRFDLSTFRSERTNEASTLTITPKRSSSRDVGISSYRYHTATYPLPVFRRIGEQTIPYLWRACKQLRHFVGCVIVRDGSRIASFVLRRL
ncbi:uncharacterized protein TNCV_557781 [Trichonephila clavipes]|nr:uncharacterized protein TNCV_557781 [Trichonephila clavipes]